MAHSDLHAVDRGWRRVGPCGGLLGIQHVLAQPTKDGLAQGRVGGCGSRDQTRKDLTVIKEANSFCSYYIVVEVVGGI